MVEVEAAWLMALSVDGEQIEVHAQSVSEQVVVRPEGIRWVEQSLKVQLKSKGAPVDTMYEASVAVPPLGYNSKVREAPQIGS